MVGQRLKTLFSLAASFVAEVAKTVASQKAAARALLDRAAKLEPEDADTQALRKSLN